MTLMYTYVSSSALSRTLRPASVRRLDSEVSSAPWFSPQATACGPDASTTRPTFLTPFNSAPGSCANVPDGAWAGGSDAPADFDAAASPASGLEPFEDVVPAGVVSPPAISYTRVARSPAFPCSMNSTSTVIRLGVEREYV